MRSLLIAPADEKRLAEALASGADAVVVDLALAAPENRAAARGAAARFLKQARARDGATALVIGVNALDSGETDADLDAVMGSAPDAILLPGSLGAASVQQLSVKLAVREADFAVPDGATRIIAVADTARGVLNMASYRGSSRRLAGLAWSAASLRADIGAEVDRDPSGAYAGASRLARELTLLAAAAASVAATKTKAPPSRTMGPSLRRRAGLASEPSAPVVPVGEASSSLTEAILSLERSWHR